MYECSNTCKERTYMYMYIITYLNQCPVISQFVLFLAACSRWLMSARIFCSSSAKYSLVETRGPLLVSRPTAGL